MNASATQGNAPSEVDRNEKEEEDEEEEDDDDEPEVLFVSGPGHRRYHGHGGFGGEGHPPLGTIRGGDATNPIELIDLIDTDDDEEDDDEEAEEEEEEADDNDEAKLPPPAFERRRRDEAAAVATTTDAAAVASAVAHNKNKNKNFTNNNNNNIDYDDSSAALAELELELELEHEIDNDNESNEDAPDLRRHCWACHLWVHHPGLAPPAGREHQVCHSALHLHPTLGVPVCVVCTEAIEDRELRLASRQRQTRKQRKQQQQQRHGGGADKDADADNSKSNSKSNDESESETDNKTDGARKDLSVGCSACGKSVDSGDLSSCGVCFRAICSRCSRQARNGGRNEGHRDGKNSSSSSSNNNNGDDDDNNDPRSCIFCPCVRQLQKERDSDSEADADACADANTAGETPGLPGFLRTLRTATRNLFSSSFSSPHEQSLEDLLEELDYLETEKLSCESRLEREGDLLEELRREILDERREDAEAGPTKTPLDIEGLVGERHGEWIDHQARLLDRISILGDLLKSRFGIEAHAAFLFLRERRWDSSAWGRRKRGKSVGESESDDNNSDSDSDADEPPWKKAADRAIEKRARAERKALRKEERSKHPPPQTPRPKGFEADADPEDAEDLGSTSSESGGHKTTTDDHDNDNDDSSASSAPDLFDLGWRKTRSRATPEEVRRARHAEDRRRVEEGNVRLVVRRGRADKDEKKRWETGLFSSIPLAPGTPGNRRSRSNKGKRSLPIRTISLVDSTGHRPPQGRAPLPKRGKGKGRNSFSFRTEPDRPDKIRTLTGRSKRERSGFVHSSLVLSKNPLITVDQRIEKHLKDHQREGIEFVFRKAFADLGGSGEEASVGGCILAHSMGLGKSLTCISLLHSVMLQPSLTDSGRRRGTIHKVLLVVPVNTLCNWEEEFEKWTGGMEKHCRLPVWNVSGAEPSTRPLLLGEWEDKGGVLLTSDALFRNMAKIEAIAERLGDADAVVSDESHIMLKNKDNLVYKAFMTIKTKRRICLTGTPFQNNLLEYYRMISYIRPNLLGSSEREFLREYSDPIHAGMGTDAPEDKKAEADGLLESFFETLRPFVHRRDASLLLRDLPSLQQVVLHLRPTKVQRALYRAYNEHQKAANDRNFLKRFVTLRSVHNHPGTLLPDQRNNDPSAPRRLSAGSKHSATGRSFAETKIDRFPAAGGGAAKPPGKESSDSVIEILSSSDEDDTDGYETCTEGTREWWTRVASTFGTDAMKDVESGNKCILLLHILAHADEMGEKTVVFSQSLKTLDFLSELLASKDWHKLCPSLDKSFPYRKRGGWIKGRDFLRIDGATPGDERRELLRDFVDFKCLKLFLISSTAGGIGINLVSANRVILFDSHFNPSIDIQAIYRCYRYGQQRNVFAYRFLTQGSMEEKVYSRAVSKIGLGNRVIDGKELRRCFRKDEIDSLGKEDDWVECVRCRQWRMFPPGHTADIANLPDEWYCEMMDEHDARMNMTCGFEEKDSVWYDRHFKKPNVRISLPSNPGATATEASSKISAAQSDELVEKDEILKKILSIPTRSKKAALIVSKHYFHEALVSDFDPSKTTATNTAATIATAEGARDPKRDTEVSSTLEGNSMKGSDEEKKESATLKQNRKSDDETTNKRKYATSRMQSQKNLDTPRPGQMRFKKSKNTANMERVTGTELSTRRLSPVNSSDDELYF